MRTNYRKAEKWRLTKYGAASSEHGDLFGCFKIPCRGIKLFAKVSSGDDQIAWEHVSVSTEIRCPTWDEMCFVKDLFWEHEETVLQFHPKKSEYVNNHPYVLHMWKLRGVDHKLPPAKCV